MSHIVEGDRHGVTFEASRDRKRLNGQALRVFDLMKDGKWRTLRDISEWAKGSEAGVSARLRDFRKPEFGNFIVERDSLGNGLFQYRLIVPEPYKQLTLF